MDIPKLKPYEVANRLQITERQREALFIVAFQKEWVEYEGNEFKVNEFQTTNHRIACELVATKFATITKMDRQTDQVFLRMVRVY